MPSKQLLTFIQNGSGGLCAWPDLIRLQYKCEFCKFDSKLESIYSSSNTLRNLGIKKTQSAAFESDQQARLVFCYPICLIMVNGEFIVSIDGFMVLSFLFTTVCVL